MLDLSCHSTSVQLARHVLGLGQVKETLFNFLLSGLARHYLLNDHLKALDQTGLLGKSLLLALDEVL